MGLVDSSPNIQPKAQQAARFAWAQSTLQTLVAEALALATCAKLDSAAMFTAGSILTGSPLRLALRIRFQRTGAWLVLCLCLWTNSAQAAPQLQASVANELDHAPATLTVWNHYITTFRVPHGEWSPAERVARAEERILAIAPVDGQWTVEHRPETTENSKGEYFSVNGQFAFRVLEGDVDREAGHTLEYTVRNADQRLRAMLGARREQGDWNTMLQSSLYALAYTLGYLLVLRLFFKIRPWIQRQWDERIARLRHQVIGGGATALPMFGQLRQLVAGLLSWALVVALTYLWLTLVLELFPYTRPWGKTLGIFLRKALADLGWGMLESLPDLVIVALIATITYAFNRGIKAYFAAAELGLSTAHWLGTDIARVTRQLIAFLTWAFALVVAYPHIPGSETEAFKGVSLILGLMVSLGSAGLVNHVMSGLTIIYSRAYRSGEFVRMGDHEGRVVKVGLLATILEKPGGAVVAIPNAVVTANMISNFSRRGEGKSELLVTSVTIGYDAPWRQVHGLLLLAAERCPEIVQDPKPFVLQRSLSDFYVEYSLHAHVGAHFDRNRVHSELLSQIQDAFNEHGVQIMSPHFLGQPEKSVTVPRSAWFTAPAVPGTGSRS